MREVDASRIKFTEKKCLARFEGGVVYTAEWGGRFYLILDESTLADLLSEKDLTGLNLIKYLEFETPAERSGYIQEKGWNQRSD